MRTYIGYEKDNRYGDGLKRETLHKKVDFLRFSSLGGNLELIS